jgi:OmpA-OmpF porin, OOP family
MRKIFLPAILLTVVVHANAQFGNDYLKAADKYYRLADYASAAVYYEKYLQVGAKGGSNEYEPYEVTIKKKMGQNANSHEAVYHLAESYRLLTNFEKAEPVYKQLLQATTGITPLAYFHYAGVLRAQAKYAEAEQSLNIFLDKYKTEDAYTNNARRELLNLRFIQEQLASADIKRYSLQKITGGRDGASYAPVVTPDNSLLFTATWADSTGSGKQRHRNRLLQANYTGAEIGNITSVELPGAPLHEGTPAISNDGNTLYITRWKIADGKKLASIYKSIKTAGGWSEPVVLNNIVNETGYSAQQPVILNNGKYLVYASDKNGGYGGYDLWCAELNSTGDPVSTTNLGEVINTPFNEEAPYYHVATGNLVFASNGKVGMGGYDLFYSTGEPSHWQQPVNFGYPVNSVKDDMYFASSNGSKKLLEDAFISSDRTAACCLELFHVNRSYKQIYTGQVVDCATNKPVTGAIITVTATDGKAVADIRSDEKGTYMIETVEGQALNIKGAKEFYKPGELTTKEKITSDTVLNDVLCLTAIPQPKKLFADSKLEVKNILFAYNDTAVATSDYEFLDQVVAYLKANPTSKIEIGAHTDGIGSVAYNLKLSANRAKACFKYLTNAGIARERMIAKGYGECCPLENEFTADKKDNPAAREKNRRIEIKLL